MYPHSIGILHRSNGLSTYLVSSIQSVRTADYIADRSVGQRHQHYLIWSFKVIDMGCDSTLTRWTSKWESADRSYLRWRAGGDNRGGPGKSVQRFRFFSRPGMDR